jgi:hypothetical protein
MATTKRAINKLSDIHLPKAQTPLEKFASELAKEEAGKSQVSIGNIRQLLKIMNKKLGGSLYKEIKAWAK